MAIILASSIISCDTPSNSNNNSNTTPNKPETITLTKENVKDYLCIEDTKGDAEIKYLTSAVGYLPYYETDIALSIYPTVPGFFSNVEIEVEIKNSISSNTSTFLPSSKKIKVPSNGTKTEVFTAKNYDSSLCFYDIEIISVSGTFQPSN